MANSRTARFLEADLKRAISACEKAGLRDYRVEIAMDGTISVIVGTGSTAPRRRNSCDDILTMDRP